MYNFTISNQLLSTDTILQFIAKTWKACGIPSKHIWWCTINFYPTFKYSICSLMMVGLDRKKQQLNKNSVVLHWTI